MQINPNYNYTFKGYDARPLKGFLMAENLRGIGNEMAEIGKKEGFKIFSLFGRCNHKICKEGPSDFNWMGYDPWTQDYWTITRNSILTNASRQETEAIKNFFGLSSINNGNGTTFLTEQKHIPGGNCYIVKSGDSEEILIGEYNANPIHSANYSAEEIKYMYGVDKVISIPQIDYHIDLFLRPLDNKRILLNDDKMGLEILKTMKDKLTKHISTIPEEEAEEFNNTLLNINEILVRNEAETLTYAEELQKERNADDVEKVLKENGYEVIRVPGNLCNIKGGIYGLTKKYKFNFINANVIKNNNNELVYITNKSDMDEVLGLTPKVKEVIGGSIEDYFTKAISKYVKPEHIYFVSGKENAVAKYMLGNCYGGIHCACAEVL